MNFRLIRLSIHVKNVRAKITRERMYTFQNNRGEKRAMFTESLLCADAALGELSPWSSASGLFFFLCPFHRWESGGIESSGRLPRVTGSRMRVQAV